MKEIVTHTALRGIAAFCVMLIHYKTILLPVIEIDQITGFLITARGFVDLFFILSGFVLSYCYRARFLRNGFRAEVGPFLINRLGRIYPLHLLTILLMLWLTVPQLDRSWMPILTENVLMIHAWGLEQVFVLNFPSWSISVEWAAYLLFGLIVILSLGRGFGIGCILAVIVSYGAFWYLTERAGVPSERLGLLRGIPAFALGVWTHIIQGRTESLSPSLRSALQLISVAAVLVVMHLELPLLFLMPFFALLVVLTGSDRGILARALSWQGFRLLGLLSYSVYMLHIPVWRMAELVWGKFVGLPTTQPVPAVIFFSACILATLIGAWLSYYLFEDPLRRLIRHAGRRRATA